MRKNKVFYYENEQTDEVVNFQIKKQKVDENYKYIHKSFLYKTISWFVYRIIASPIFYVYFKLVRPVKYVNKKILKQSKNSGYFLYGNHTNHLGDGCNPTFICFPQKPHIICSSDNVFIPIIGIFNRMCGAIPLPDTIKSSKLFHQAIEHCLNLNNPIVIYPEAHLWPYYTKIRPFPSMSFRYPIKYNKPSYVLTTTYVKRKFTKIPKTIVYVDGPFMPDQNLSPK